MNEIYKNTPIYILINKKYHLLMVLIVSNTLYEYIISAYEEITNTSRHHMNPLNLMRLHKDILHYHSLTRYM